MTVVTPVRPASGVSAKAAYTRASDRLAVAIERLEQKLPHASEQDTSTPHPEPKAATPPEAYMAKVARAKEYIAAGDIFQVVLSQRFEAPFTLPSFALYRALRRVNPSPFLYYLNFGDFAVVGSSPEILVRVRDGKVTIRPIAGTRPRGATPAQDKALAKELLSRRQGAGRAPNAARSRPERRRPRGRDRHRARHRLSSSSNITAR